MPVTGSSTKTKPSTVKTSITGKDTSNNSGNGGRTTFRPPWVKENETTTAPAASTKSTTVPWSKRGQQTTVDNATTKENGQTNKPTTTTIKKDTKLQSREIKVPVVTTERKSTTPTPLKSTIKDKDKTIDIPDEDEIEAEIEKKEKEFKLEKPKLRHVAVNRNKSFTRKGKNDNDDDDDDDNDGGGGGGNDDNDDDEGKERRGRFKLEKPKLRHVVVNKDKQTIKTETEEPKFRPALKKTPKVDELSKPIAQEPVPEFKEKVLKKIASRDHLRRESSINVPAPPPLPTLTAPKPPPPPPPPTLGPPPDFEKKALSNKAKETIEKLKMRARRRPDWSEMMKEVEQGKKLKHVECNDRSKPIISTKSMTKVAGQFVFETEKANVHNQLLKQIQGGIKLRPTKCNDRSKPILEGLRKFRRQMTIEEQIQKSESRASALNEAPPDEESEDEMDDIDKLRDDLQSTKQLLGIELRNKETQERENKRLLAKIANLEAELEREKQRTSAGESRLNSLTGADEALVRSLRKDADESRKTCKELENKYQNIAEQYDDAKEQIEKQKNQIAQLERKLSQAIQGHNYNNSFSRPQYSFCYSFEDPYDHDFWAQQGTLPSVGSRRPSEATQKESSPDIDIELSESESEEDEEKKAAKTAKRLSREIKMLRIKLGKLKDRQTQAKKERLSLRDAMKKNQTLLKEENKKFKKLEKEVEKMAKLMKEEGDEDEEEEEEEEEVEEEEETEESESEESEDEETISDTESESEAEDASDEAKKNNLDPRVKRHEGRLSALKKGNFLLQANVDRLQDEINKIREKSVDLQAELDSVLSELG